MKDTIIKGTGNSRSIKSVSNFATQYPTYDSFKSAMASSGIPVDIGGVNAAGMTQVGTPLNKSTLLSDSTAEMYGLNGSTATVDDALRMAATEMSGIEWTLARMPSDSSFSSISFGSGKFVSTSSTKEIFAYSSDGINWTQIQSPIRAGSIAYGNGKFLASASSGNTAVYSSNGISWSTTTLPISTNGYLKFVNGRFILIPNGQTRDIYYSTTGTSWTRTNLPDNLMNGMVAYGNGRYVLLSNNGSYSYYSTDLTNWTKNGVGSVGHVSSIAFGNGKFVAGGDSISYYYSTDGANWTKGRTIHAKGYYKLAFIDGKFISFQSLASDSGAISSDGINWKPTKMPVIASWSRAAYGNGKIVTVGDDVCAYGVTVVSASDLISALLE